jgi:hypothetical protein
MTMTHLGMQKMSHQKIVHQLPQHHKTKKLVHGSII